MKFIEKLRSFTISVGFASTQDLLFYFFPTLEYVKLREDRGFLISLVWLNEMLYIAFDKED